MQFIIINLNIFLELNFRVKLIDCSHLSPLRNYFQLSPMLVELSVRWGLFGSIFLFVLHTLFGNSKEILTFRQVSFKTVKAYRRVDHRLE